MPAEKYLFSKGVFLMFIIDIQMDYEKIIKTDNQEFFPDDRMVKAVADVDKGVLAVNASLHSDIEEYLLENGSKQESLYGFNIYDDGSIEYDSMINPPRNRADGYPRGGRDVSSPEKRQLIKELVDKWILPC